MTDPIDGVHVPRPRRVCSTTCRLGIRSKGMIDMQHLLLPSLGAMAVTAVLTMSCNSAQAVELNPEGRGQAVITPVWATTHDHGSIFTITALPETDGLPSAPIVARFRLFDAPGNTVFVANIYFNGADDQWTFGLGGNGEGASTLVSSDSTCALVEDQSGVAPFTGQADIAADHGYAVAISMGSLADGNARVAAENGDCEALVANWNEGAWSPDPLAGTNPQAGFEERAPGPLAMNASVVNVQRGTLYAVPATALVSFSDIPQHARPASETPNLATAHDPGTNGGHTNARACSAGACATESYDSPIEAVAAVMTTTTLGGRFDLNPGLGAHTDVILMSPLTRFFAGDVGILDGSTLLDRAGKLLLQNDQNTPCFDNPDSTCHYQLYVEWGAGSLKSVDNIEAPIEYPSTTDVLGLPVDLAFTFQAPTDAQDLLNATAGSIDLKYNGIAVLVREFVNAQLSGPEGAQVRANYGVMEAMERKEAN